MEYAPSVALKYFVLANPVSQLFAEGRKTRVAKARNNHLQGAIEHSEA
jgi:hypothetical protein